MPKSDIKKLEEYIERHLEKGFSLRKVKHELVLVGHSIEAIEEAQKNVFSRKPHLKRRPELLKFLALFVLGLVATGLILFVASKVSEQYRYQKAVQQFELNQSFSLMTDNELLYYARDHNTLAPCPFVKDHNKYYACLDRLWERGDCTFESLLGENTSQCYYDIAIRTNDVALCELHAGPLLEKCKLHFFQLAIERNDSALCGDTTTGIGKRCAIALEVKKGNVSVCYAKSNVIFDECKQQSMEFQLNVLKFLCGWPVDERFVNEEMKHEKAEKEREAKSKGACLFFNISQTKDVSSCDVFKEPHPSGLLRVNLDYYNTCIMGVNMASKSSESCALLSDEVFRVSCDATTRNNEKACSVLGELKNFCTALVKRDTELCSSLRTTAEDYSRACTYFVTLIS